MSIFRRFLHKVVLMLPAVLLLLSASSAWSQSVTQQIQQTIYGHTVDELQSVDFPNELLTEQNPTEPPGSRSFEAIAFLSNLDLVAADGTNILIYPGGIGPFPGFQNVTLVAGTVTGDSTGLVSTTSYDLSANIDGTVITEKILGSDAATYTALITEIDSLLGTTTTFESTGPADAHLEIVSPTTGGLSVVDILDFQVLSNTSDFVALGDPNNGGADTRDLSGIVDGLALKSVGALAVDPDSGDIFPIGLRKGKPVFQMGKLVPDGAGGYETADPPIVAQDFPRPIDAVYVSAFVSDPPTILDGGGVLLAGAKSIVWMGAEAPTAFGPVELVGKKGLLLAGNEQVTGIASFPGEVRALVATDRGRVMDVDLSGNNPTTLFVDLRVGEEDPCVSVKEQVISVRVTAGQGDPSVVISDSACRKVHLFDSEGGQQTLETNSSEIIGLATVEGVSINFANCNPCNISSQPGAAQVEVDVVAGPNEGVAFQVTGLSLPDN
jgi:hypothetical protein